MPEGLQIQVGADVSQAEKAFAAFAKDAETAGKRAADGIAGPLAKVPPAVSRATNALNKVPQATNKAKFSMIELSRVVQDLPYGFTGIANNLTQLIPGIGFLGLAFSGLVSAITFSQIGTSAWTRSAGGAKKGADDLAVATSNAAQEQERFSSAMNDAAAAVINEADKISDLRRILIDTSNDYNTLTESIIKQGIAQALFSDKEGIIQKQIARAVGDRLKVEKTLAEFKADTFEETKKDYSLQKQINDASASGLKVIGVVEDQNLKKAKERVVTYKEEQRQIGIINDIARSLGITFDKFVKQDKVFEPKFLTKDLSKSLLKVLLLDEISLDVRGIKFRTIPKTDMDRMREQLEKGISSKPAQVSIDIKLNQEKLNAAKQQFEAFTADINNSFKSIGVDSLANIGDVIGQALTGGDIGKAFQGFAEIVGSGLQQIGKQLIQVGLLAKLSQKALSQLFFNPGLAIATGIALSAAGAALKSAFKGGIKGFAQGGLVFGPTVGMVGEGFNTRRSNPEVIAPLDKLRSIIGESGGSAVRVVVTGRLRGNDMALMNARTSRKNGRLGG